jgi:hypothetical protein
MECLGVRMMAIREMPLKLGTAEPGSRTAALLAAL